MLSPIESAPASRAPRLAASMAPGPPPVMTARPASPTMRAVSRASAYSGSSGGVRAEPKNDAAGPTWASASKPIWSSALDALDAGGVGERGEHPGFSGAR